MSEKRKAFMRRDAREDRLIAEEIASGKTLREAAETIRERLPKYYGLFNDGRHRNVLAHAIWRTRGRLRAGTQLKYLKNLYKKQPELLP